MSDQLLFFAGNRNPSLTETITADGAVVDLTGSTVAFKMRPVGGSSLTLTGATVVVSAPAGTVRFDWGTGDLATAGQYLVWWQVTTGAKTQDMAEALIEVRDHAPTTPPAYVELEQVKSSLTMTGFTFADQDILLACSAASRAIDNACDRRFYLDADATGIRYYQPDPASSFLVIDDLATASGLAVTVDRDGDGTYEETWTNGTDFVLEPFNATTKSRPYETLRIRSTTSRTFPAVEKSVKVTGQFGWPRVPADIQTAASIIASKLVKRTREAPFGIVTSGSEVGIAMRIARYDPEVHPTLESYTRSPYVG